jgi:hypothetical protein
MKAPLLLQIDLLGSPQEPVGDRWLAALSELASAERPLVLLDARPDRWAPTLSRVDRAFERQATIEAELRRAGGTLDAVIYLDFGLFGRRREYERNLADLANRYNVRVDDMTLVARPGKMAEALGELVGELIVASSEHDLKAALKQAATHQ